jgi:integrase
MPDTRALLLAADAQDPEFAALLRVLAATGARRGEVCGLRWSDLDTKGGTLFIRRSVASVAGKTHAARRIALDPGDARSPMRWEQLRILAELQAINATVVDCVHEWSGLAASGRDGAEIDEEASRHLVGW